MTELPDTQWIDPPVLAREADELPDALPRGAEIPEDLDPLAEGVLMAHQAEWLEDESDLKVCAKGRRTGITFAEALDDTLIAAAKRSAGGQNVFYIGDTKDKGREFIGYVAHFAKTVAKEMLSIEDSVFIDEREDGTTRFISSFRISFASGFRVEALSSRPENIRGLQGVVVIDEAAFHKNVRDVLDAVNALLIWGRQDSRDQLAQRGSKSLQRTDPGSRRGQDPVLGSYLLVRSRSPERALQARVPDQGHGMDGREGGCLGSPDPRLLRNAHRQDEAGARCNPGRGRRRGTNPRPDRELHVARSAAGGSLGPTR
jgi:hypothetical protein